MIEKIERYKEEKKIDELIDLLESGKTKERLEAAKALGEVKNDEGLSLLKEKVMDDDEEPIVRANCILALTNFDLEDVKQTLKEAAQDEDWEVRHDTAIAMGEYEIEDFKECLRSLLEDEELEVRKKALESLGKIGNEEEIDTLSEYLEDGNLKKSAIKAIRYIGSKSGVLLLRDLFFESDDPEVKEIAIRGMKDGKKEEVKSVLLEALDDESWRIREESTIIIGDLGLEDYVNELEKKLDDKNKHVIEAAARSLGKIAEEEKEDVVESLSGSFDDDSPEVRIAIGDALGNIDNESSAHTLIRCIESETNPRVLWSLSESISSLSKNNLETILGELETVDGEKRIFLNVALTKGGLSTPVKELIPLLESERWKERQKVIEALGSIDPNELSKSHIKKILRKLRGRLRDSDKWVRARAVETYGNYLKKLEKEIDMDISDLKQELFELKKVEADPDVFEIIEKFEKDIKIDKR